MAKIVEVMIENTKISRKEIVKQLGITVDGVIKKMENFHILGQIKESTGK